MALPVKVVRVTDGREEEIISIPGTSFELVLHTIHGFLRPPVFVVDVTDAEITCIDVGSAHSALEYSRSSNTSSRFVHDEGTCREQCRQFSTDVAICRKTIGAIMTRKRSCLTGSKGNLVTGVLKSNL